MAVRSIPKPPVAGPPTAAGPQRVVKKPRLRDTEPDFPEMAEPARGDKNSSSQVLPTSDSVGWAHPPTVQPDVEPDMETPAEPVSILRPLLVFVLLPLALVAAVVLIWWLVEAWW